MKRALVLAAALSPTLALAQSQVESGITRAVPILVGIGMAISTIGFIVCGIKYTSGDPMAKEHTKGVLVGSALILTASVLTGLMRSWFGS